MIIEWHVINGKAEAYTLHNPCCEHWISDDDFQNYLNYQPTGVFLEVPMSLAILFTKPWYNLDGEDEPLVHWRRIGKLEWCPFCGARINITKTETPN